MAAAIEAERGTEQPDAALPTRASQHPRISSLDGIRALSVFAVVAAHVVLGKATRTQDYSTLQYLTFRKLGELGLIFFFVISGFLITLILLGELDASGHISIRRFYFRRALRIIPPIYAYIGVLAIAGAFGFLSLTRAAFIAPLTFASNYWGQGTPGFWYVAHTWTLAVDAQFYVLWPLALGFGGKKRGAQVAFAFLIISPVARYLQATHGGHAHDGFLGFEGVADCMATGCLLALYRDRLHAMRWYRTLLGSQVFGVVPVAAIGVILLAAYPSILPIEIYATFGIPFINLGATLSLDWAVTYPSRGAGRVLNSRPLAYLGAMSYSIYLWQQFGLNPDYGGRGRILLGLTVSAAAAVMSYYLIERPALRLRTYLEPRLLGTRNRKELARAEVPLAEVARSERSAPVAV